MARECFRSPNTFLCRRRQRCRPSLKLRYDGKEVDIIAVPAGVALPFLPAVERQCRTEVEHRVGNIPSPHHGLLPQRVRVPQLRLAEGNEPEASYSGKTVSQRARRDGRTQSYVDASCMQNLEL